MKTLTVDHNPCNHIESKWYNSRWSEFVVLRKNIDKIYGSPYRFAWLCNHPYGMVFSIPFCEPPLVLHGCVRIRDTEDHCMPAFIEADFE